MTEPRPILYRKLLAFVAGLLVIHGLFYAFYAQVIRPNHKLSKSDQLWYRSPPKVDLVFLGDSHPRAAVEPRSMPDHVVVNLATGGEHYTKNYYRFKRLFNRRPRQVGAVVIPLDMSSFASWHEDAFSPEYVWSRYVNFMELGRLRDQRWIFAGRAAKARLIPYAGELRTMNQLRAGRFGFADYLAAGNFDNFGPEAQERMGTEAVREHFTGSRTLSRHHKQGFDLILDWLRDHDIQAVCLSYPLTSAYLDAAQLYGDDPRAVVQREVIDPLATEHPEVIHLDYTDYLRGQPDLFADPHHLNAVGRRLFTKELERRFTELGLLDPSAPEQ